jgi:ribosome-associated protein
MHTELKQIVVDALEDIKGRDITCLDVTQLTNITDHMVIVSGTSNRHVKSLADNVVSKAKEHGFCPIGVEGENPAEWILVDLGDVVVHVMLPNTRQFYDLERLWTAYPEAASVSHVALN